MRRPKKDGQMVWDGGRRQGQCIKCTGLRLGYEATRVFKGVNLGFRVRFRVCGHLRFGGYGLGFRQRVD